MNDLDYLYVLRALHELPFNVGKKLLMDFLCGNERNESIKKHKLSRFASFSSLSGYALHEVEGMVDSLSQNNLIEQVSLQSNKFVKVYGISLSGRAELVHPALYTKKLSARYHFKEMVITAQDRELFNSFDFFLSKCNDEQKKAIVSRAEKILCVAGAGSGKTTTLTKRIEFLIKFRSVNPQKILAITFTRKARQEMQKRLSAAGITVRVETFNSFCEKILQAYNNLAYDRQTRVISFREKTQLVQQALCVEGKTLQHAVDLYYSFEQKRGKTSDELAQGFVNDCFSILDHCKGEDKQLKNFSQKEGLQKDEKVKAAFVYEVCLFMQQRMQELGLRDYSDQMLDVVGLFRKNSALISQYEHVLVDEYQDINAVQMSILDLLAPQNLFCVGDPRQSIFGWRGSKVSYILDFEKKYLDAEVVALTKNYRSSPEIVRLINESIKVLRLPDLDSATTHSGEVMLIKCESEVEESQMVVQKIMGTTLARPEIFVLARTNRQLKELSDLMKLRRIQHIIRNDEVHAEAGEGEVTLSTVHAIKGMEADMVFVLGCTGIYFPCKSSDHPVVDMVKETDYDKEEEERRLFYVAMSRARKHLYLSYVGNSLTRFVTPEMKNMLQIKSMRPQAECFAHEERQSSISLPSLQLSADAGVLAQLKSWRRQVAQQANIPAYMIFHDKVLIELAGQKPKSLQELAKIKGMGPVKLEKYGQQLLNILLADS